MNQTEYQRVVERTEVAKKLCQTISYDWRYREDGIDEFKEKSFDIIKRRLQMLGAFKDDNDVGTVSDTVFTEVQWNRYKKIYNFNPTFVKYLATTEAGEVRKAVLEKLPFKSFYISFGGKVLDNRAELLEPTNEQKDSEKKVIYRRAFSEDFTPCIGMFVHIYFYYSDEGGGWFTNFAITLLGEDNCSVPLFIGLRDGELMSEVTEKVRNYIMLIHNGDPKQIEMIERKQEIQKPFFMLVMNACQYLCASNAEIRDVKVPKKDKPVVKMKDGKTKPISVQVSNVGFRLGQQFEKMYRDLELEGSRSGLKGIRRKPHVRRAHWHHYWTGPGRTVLEVRWLEPVFVMGSEEEIDAVIHEVKGA